MSKENIDINLVKLDNFNPNNFYLNKIPKVRDIKKEKTVTCATIIISSDKKSILLGKIAKQDKYDLPKGRMEEGENYLEAAKREMYEETNLDIDEEKYLLLQSNDDLKVIRYNKEKNIVAFFIYDKDNIYLNNNNLKNLIKCNTYIDKKCIYPELSDFKLFSIEKILHDDEFAKSIFNKSMFKFFRREFIVRRLKTISSLS